jgi:hypothetical protein
MDGKDSCCCCKLLGDPTIKALEVGAKAVAKELCPDARTSAARPKRDIIVDYASLSLVLLNNDARITIIMMRT